METLLQMQTEFFSFSITESVYDKITRVVRSHMTKDACYIISFSKAAKSTCMYSCL